jgi:hypothetical protein
MVVLPLAPSNQDGLVLVITPRHASLYVVIPLRLAPKGKFLISAIFSVSKV